LLAPHLSAVAVLQRLSLRRNRKSVYLQLNKKKAKAEGKKCHAKTDAFFVFFSRTRQLLERKRRNDEILESRPAATLEFVVFRTVD
jgi:hypothetical protein